jgi:uncharacterized protein (DUF2141 family)
MILLCGISSGHKAKKGRTAMFQRAAILSFVIIASLLFSSPARASDAGKITIKIEGLRNSSGVVRIALFNSEKAYSESASTSDQAGEAFRKAVANISGNTADCTFEDVPYGDYAIKLFHDEDNTGKFKKNKLGIPQVQYGFSNNAKAMFGPAPYAKAKFSFHDPVMNTTINVK